MHAYARKNATRSHKMRCERRYTKTLALGSDEGAARAGAAIRYTYICSTRGADLELAMVNFCCKKKGPARRLSKP